MLDGGDFGVAQNERGGESCFFDQLRLGGNVSGRLEIGTAEDDSGIRRSAFERDLNANAGVQGNASGRYLTCEGVLLWHGAKYRFAL